MREKKEIKRATAETSLEIWVHCPNCTRYLNETTPLREEIGDDLRAEDIDVEITCCGCDEVFVVDQITY